MPLRDSSLGNVMNMHEAHVIELVCFSLVNLFLCQSNLQASSKNLRWID